MVVFYKADVLINLFGCVFGVGLKAGCAPCVNVPFVHGLAKIRRFMYEARGESMLFIISEEVF